jgi:hypothetical protein
MSVSLVTGLGLYMSFRQHLAHGPEEVGFFLASYDAGRRAFELHTWRPIPPDGFESQTDFHFTLRDTVRADVIKWAWDSDACLIEAHSHRPDGLASFSPSDVWGFEQWVPRVWWRLRGRPYAAIVIGGETFDALAWIEGANAPEQVEQMRVDGETHLPTRLTLTRRDALRERSHDV